MTYTVKNKQHDQDNINFIDLTNPKEEMPSFLDYDEVLQFSIENGNIENEEEIKSLCDGGDHVQPYFSSMSASEECEIYVENTSDGKTLEFDSEKEVYEFIINNKTEKI